jgi:hypothetical protein
MEKIIMKKKPTKGGDATGVERGARGYGELTEMDREFLRPDFNRQRQQGERAVGMFATSTKPLCVDNAQLEGDDA